MEPKHSKRFELSLDDDPTNTAMREELHELKIEKLSTRVTLLSILIPCVIGIVLFIAYLDIKDRVTQTHDTGTIGVQKLSKDLESKFSSLSLQQAKINDTISSRLPPLEESIDVLQVRINQLNDGLKKLKSASLNENDLQKIVDRFNEAFGDMPDQLKENARRLNAMAERLQEEIEIRSRDFEGLLGTMNETRQSLKGIKTETARLAREKISKKDMDLALRLKEMALEDKMRETVADLDESVAALKRQVKALQQKVDANGTKSHAKPTDATAGGETDAAAGGETDGPDVEPGVIIEQPLE